MKKPSVLFAVLVSVSMLTSVIFWQIPEAHSQTPMSTGGEVLANGGFESGLANWSVPSWFASLVSLDGSLAHGGSKALLFKGRANGPYVYQEAAAATGQALAVSGWVNVTQRTGYQQLVVELVARSANNGNLKTFSITSISNTTNGWARFTGSAVLPGQTAKVRIQIRFAQLYGSAYFDDLSVIASGSPNPSPTATATATSTNTPIPTNTATNTPTPMPSPTPVPGGSTLYGAWVGSSVNIAGDESVFEQALGKPRAIRHWYWSVAPVSWSASNFADWSSSMPAGAILMLSWAPSPVDSTLDNVNAGVHDAYVTEWATALKAYGGEVLLRPMWEDNGSWFWWSSGRNEDVTQKSKYKAAFQRIVNIFRLEGATNVKLVWCPNVSGFGAGLAILSYPGDAYVDWVGLDGYPLRGGWGDFYATFKADYDASKCTGETLHSGGDRNRHLGRLRPGQVCHQSAHL